MPRKVQIQHMDHRLGPICMGSPMLVWEDGQFKERLRTCLESGHLDEESGDGRAIIPTSLGNLISYREGEDGP